MTDTAHPVQETHALLADGWTVEIRPTRPEDHAAVGWLFDRLSAENLRLRFFGASRRAGRQAADRVCGSHSRPPGAAGPARGTGRRPRRVRDRDRPLLREIALTVADDLHHQGVGTLLLEHLVDRAGQDGITTFTAEALADNHPVLKVFADLGLNTVRHFDGTAVH
ncbi:GNAT family N-acetyltransferase [Streptomyces sp. RKAG293]|uniref:GNAT family N-acetyltransferase n=1 Tax=Streptomyces sp. RKAG293 TaxID=2893403 RepID=UPI00203490F3|nr:GNAT family N-acetyltransferase [Streptomyces sp. RKAG293]MCM2422718.1 GNAT family N-acetyltransferase [Streptomyces sp. RKAG293]